VITKTYDLILWSCRHTGRFPRNHRFVLGERIERTLHGLLETLIRARYNSARQPLLEEPNLALEILRFQMRLAKDLQCLKTGSYAFAATAIDDIGRLVGGWLKTGARPRNATAISGSTSARSRACSVPPSRHAVENDSGPAWRPFSTISRRPCVASFGNWKVAAGGQGRTGRS
jgi:hypothetical protein